MITSFTARRYRNVDCVEVPLGRVNVLLGPNNSGKSNFLKALTLPGDVARGISAGSAKTPWTQAVQRRGGADVLRWDADFPQVELHYTVKIPGQAELKYDIEFKVPSPDQFERQTITPYEAFAFSRASDLVQGGANDDNGSSTLWINQIGFGPDLRIPTLKPSSWIEPSSQVALRAALGVSERHLPLAQEASQPLIDLFARMREYNVGDMDLRLVRGTTRAEPAQANLDAAGAQFSNCLRHLEQTSEDGLAPIEDALRALLPDLRRLWVKDGSGSRWTELQQNGRTASLSDMSHGTIRGLILALLLHTPERLSLLAIDEPELNLHPAWMQIVGRWLLRCRSADQVFISTHSPDLLDVFTEGFRQGDVKVLVFDQNTSGVRSIDPLNLDDRFEQGWELGDLYRVGERQLGGWPW